MYSLGVDVGGTKVNLGLIDEVGVVREQQAVLIKGNNAPELVVELIAETLKELLAKCGIEMSEIAACGMGVPGTVDSGNRVAIKVPNLGWQDTPIADLFEAKTGIPTSVLQDSRAAAYGEYMAGAGKGSELLVCISLGTGIGTGIVLGGNMFGGALGCAGEIGHVPVVDGGRKCGCGRIGCLECYAAGKGLDISAAELLGEGATAHELFDEAKGGNEKAKAIIDEAVVLLGRQIVSIVNLVSPDCLLFSGGLSRQKELFLDPIIHYVESHCYRTEGGRQLTIAPSKLGADSAMVGAGLFRR